MVNGARGKLDALQRFFGLAFSGIVDTNFPCQPRLVLECTTSVGALPISLVRIVGERSKPCVAVEPAPLGATSPRFSFARIFIALPAVRTTTRNVRQPIPTSITTSPNKGLGPLTWGKSTRSPWTKGQSRIIFLGWIGKIHRVVGKWDARLTGRDDEASASSWLSTLPPSHDMRARVPVVATRSTLRCYISSGRYRDRHDCDACLTCAFDVRLSDLSALPPTRIRQAQSSVLTMSSLKSLLLAALCSVTLTSATPLDARNNTSDVPLIDYEILFVPPSDYTDPGTLC